MCCYSLLAPCLCLNGLGHAGLVESLYRREVFALQVDKGHVTSSTRVDKYEIQVLVASARTDRMAGSPCI